MRIPATQTKSVDALLAAGIASIQIASFVALRRTSSQPERDPFDSHLYPYMWLIYPALITIASLLRSGHWRLELWTAALALPFVTEILLVGTALAPSDTGANLWIVGELLAIVHCGFAYMAGFIALRVRHVHFDH